MERRGHEEKTEVNATIFIILVVGAVLGAFVGGVVIENINAMVNVFIKVAFCIATSCTGAIVTIVISYYVICTIIEVRSAIKDKKRSN